jgi:hypothetical protein
MTDNPRFHEFGPDGASLRDELGGVFTDERLREWAGDSAERREFLADKILGTISWEKSLGRPASTDLYEGFVVEHAYLHVEIDQGPEGPVRQESWRQLDPPALWDGAEDAERYYVGFFDFVTGSFKETIAVRLADRGWEGGTPFSGTRRVDPPDLEVGKPSGRPVLLSFAVIAKPHFEPQRSGGMLGG